MEDAVRRLVVIGASAGGVDALSTVIGSLPAGFPAPIVVAQHLDPRHRSHLHEILGRHAKLRVETIADHERLAAGVVYVIPPGRHLEIGEREVRLIVDGHHRPLPSIDLLLTTAAEAYGEHLTAVILTGSGSDGAEGARRVTAAGGTVLVQNPATAEFPSMPRSLSPTTVDAVAELDEIGPLLIDLTKEPRIAQRNGDGSKLLDEFLGQLRGRSGIDFASYKRPTIMRRLQRRMMATGSPDLHRYVEHLRDQPDEVQRLTSSFLLKVTEFFRDPDLFERLRREWLPELIRDAQRRGEELRIWSAGCATGEEAYSLAMLVAEALRTTKNPPQARVFATDLDDVAIGFARRGIYPRAAFANVPAELRDRYVNELDGEGEVAKLVRSLVIFGQHDLGQRAPFPRIDLILCRNVLIYFQADLQRRALQLFSFSLRDGGLLVLGKAETTAAVRGAFRLVDRRLKVYERSGPRDPLPAVHLSQPALASQPLVPSRPVAPALDLAVMRARREAERKRAAADHADRLLLALRTGVVVVDEHYDIGRINAAARQMLSIHGTAIGDDFVHLAIGLPSTALRGLLDSALRGQPAEAVMTVTTSATESGEGARLEVSCTPLAGEGEAGLVIVELRDVSSSEAAHVALEQRLSAREAEIETARAAQAEEAASRHAELEQALAGRDRALEEQATRLERFSDTHRQLLSANRELTDANLLLRSTNDELLISNEEVQASSEEVETLNEELQATNEELETLNEELQATVEELNSTNAELESRSAEIEEANEALAAERESSERQRQRLATTMASMADAVMMVGSRGESLVTNAAYEELFAGAEESVLEPEGSERVPSREALQRRAAAGETFLAQFAIRAPDGSRRWFEAKGRPLRSDGGERGGVVVIRDITDRSLRDLQDQFVAMVAHELRTPLSAMMGYVELVSRGLAGIDESDDRLRRFADRAVGQAHRMAELVGDLLDANRLQRGDLAYLHEPIDLAALVEEMVEVSRPLAEGTEIRVHGITTPVEVMGDPGRLQQVVLNLLNNARQHGGAGKPIEVTLRRRGSKVMLSVRDHGPGIRRSDQEQLFTRFFRAEGSAKPRSGGLGLGLYISRQIVEAHSGTIAVRSQPGRGATFTVTLPVKPPGGPSGARGSRRR